MNYDWIVIGAGITGAALSYELAKNGFSVLLLERHSCLQGATRFSYGGLAYWSGTTTLTRQLCAEGKELYGLLSDELGADTQFRELDLVLTIPTVHGSEVDLKAVAQSYAHFAVPPQLLSVSEACELEPLLNRTAIAGALTVPHGHISPELTTQAYIQAFTKLGGTVQVGEVTQLLREKELQVSGVVAGNETYHSANVVVCTGALSRSLLKTAGISVRIYFTHAEMIETPPVEVRLRTLVMPAETKRFQLEATASAAEVDNLWNQPGYEPALPIFDPGAIQFLDGSFRIGQVSRVLTDPDAKTDAAQSEAQMRSGIGEILPALKDLPGVWHRCLIAFSCDRLPLVGAVPNIAGVHLFSGFSNPLAIVPAIARRFAANATGQEDELIAQLSPTRFV